MAVDPPMRWNVITSEAGLVLDVVVDVVVDVVGVVAVVCWPADVASDRIDVDVRFDVGAREVSRDVVVDSAVVAVVSGFVDEVVVDKTTNTVHIARSATPASAVAFGEGCAAPGLPLPRIVPVGAPVENTTAGVIVCDAVPGTSVVLGVAIAIGQSMTGPCTQWVSL